MNFPVNEIIKVTSLPSGTGKRQKHNLEPKEWEKQRKCETEHRCANRKD